MLRFSLSLTLYKFSTFCPVFVLDFDIMWGDGVVVEVMMKGLPLSERNCKTQKKNVFAVDDK